MLFVDLKAFPWEALYLSYFLSVALQSMLCQRLLDAPSVVSGSSFRRTLH
jgi:hypothetical protein